MKWQSDKHTHTHPVWTQSTKLGVDFSKRTKYNGLRNKASELKRPVLVAMVEAPQHPPSSSDRSCSTCHKS